MSVHADPPPELVVDPHGLHYATGSQIGKGGFAICHRAELLDRSKPTGQIIALKIVRSKMEPPKLAQKVRTSTTPPKNKLLKDRITVCHRAPDSFEASASTYCGILSGIRIRDEHVCCVRDL